MRIQVVFWCLGFCVQAAELKIQPEYLRTSPDGEVIVADRPAAGHPRSSAFPVARAGYLSLQVIALLRAPGEYSLEMTPPSGIHADVFREWYHVLERRKRSGFIPTAASHPDCGEYHSISVTGMALGIDGYVHWLTVSPERERAV